MAEELTVLDNETAPNVNIVVESYSDIQDAIVKEPESEIIEEQPKTKQPSAEEQASTLPTISTPTIKETSFEELEKITDSKINNTEESIAREAEYIVDSALPEIVVPKFIGETIVPKTTQPTQMAESGEPQQKNFEKEDLGRMPTIDFTGEPISSIEQPAVDLPISEPPSNEGQEFSANQPINVAETNLGDLAPIANYAFSPDGLGEPAAASGDFTETKPIQSVSFDSDISRVPEDISANLPDAPAPAASEASFDVVPEPKIGEFVGDNLSNPASAEANLEPIRSLEAIEFSGKDANVPTIGEPNLPDSGQTRDFSVALPDSTNMDISKYGELGEVIVKENTPLQLVEPTSLEVDKQVLETAREPQSNQFSADSPTPLEKLAPDLFSLAPIDKLDINLSSAQLPPTPSIDLVDIPKTEWRAAILEESQKEAQVKINFEKLDKVSSKEIELKEQQKVDSTFRVIDVPSATIPEARAMGWGL